MTGSTCYVGNNITVDMVNNTIPILLANIDCNYINLIYLFQHYGARAVVMINNISTNDKYINDSWIPYDCIIMFNKTTINYFHTFAVIEPQLMQELMEVFETNIQNTYLKDISYGSISYQFTVNNSDPLHAYVPNTLISRYIESYLKLHTTVELYHIGCERGSIVTKIQKPTIYDEIYLPIGMITVSNISQFIERYKSDELEIVCNTASSNTTLNKYTYALFVHPDYIYWDDAELYCQQHCNSHLASIHSNEDFEQIKDRISQTIGRPPYWAARYVWIGLHDKNIEGKFEWTDGSSWDYGNITNPMGIYPWNLDNPNNFGGFQHCVAIKPSNTTNSAEDRWNDLHFTVDTRAFVCNSCTTGTPTILSEPPTLAPNVEPTSSPTSTPTTNPTLPPTLNPSNAPSRMPTDAPSSYPTSETLSPTTVPTSNPTIIPTTYPTTNYTDIKSEFVILTYLNDTPLDLLMAISFSQLSVAKFVKIYNDICQIPINENMEINNEHVYFVTIDTVFAEFNSICVQFNNASNTTLVDWTVIQNEDLSSSIDLVTSTLNVIEKGCSSNTQNSRTSIPNIHRGTYCFAIWSNTNHDDNTLEYNIRIKQLFKWTLPFIKINNSRFINNTNIGGEGGAITITTGLDIYEFVSISIYNTIFDANYASMGGAAIYRRSSQSKYNGHFQLMSVTELNNIQIYNRITQDLHDESIKTELIASDKKMFIFRNAIRIKNMMITTIGNNDNSVTGLLNLHGTNIYITDSNMSKGSGFNGGCIFIMNTALTLHNSQIKECRASNNGGGLYQSLYTEYSLYDICLSIYYTKFMDNSAGNNGGAGYLALHGDNNKQSCVKIFNVEYISNTAQYGAGNSMYLSVSNGTHDLLDNFGTLSNVCNGEKCEEFSSTLRYLCMSILNDGGCRYDDIVDEIIEVKATWVTINVFGWDAFGNLLNATSFEIDVVSNKATIQSPHGHISANQKYYLVPLIVNDSQNASVVIIDPNDIASTLKFVLNLAAQAYKFVPVLDKTLLYLLLLLVPLCLIVSCVLLWCRKQYMDALVVDKVLVLIIGIIKFKNKDMNLPSDKNNIDKLVGLWRD
eukprot:544451_1